MSNKTDQRIRMRKSAATGKRTDRVKKAEHERILKLRDKGKTIEEIAAALNRSERTISKQLSRAETDSQEATSNALLLKLQADHIAYMADIAFALLATTHSYLDNVTANRISDGAVGEDVFYGDDAAQWLSGRRGLAACLRRNLDIASGIEPMTAEEINKELADGTGEWFECKVYPKYDFSCLMYHVEAECPEVASKGLDRAVEENPYEIIDAVRRISRRKILRGKCPICRDWQ